MDSTRSEALVRIAPRAVPRINSYDYGSRSPVLVVTTGSTFFHLDLEELTAEEAQATVTRMRSALEVFAEQLAEWQRRAASDACGPYAIPPVPYGTWGPIQTEETERTGETEETDAGDGGEVGGSGDAG